MLEKSIIYQIIHSIYALSVISCSKDPFINMIYYLCNFSLILVLTISAQGINNLINLFFTRSDVKNIHIFFHSGVIFSYYCKFYIKNKLNKNIKRLI